MSISEHELAAEQKYIDELCRIVGDDAARLREQLAAELKDSGRSGDRLLGREVTVDYLRRRLGALGAADSGLCFGNMSTPETTTYLGRLGLFPDDPDAEPLLLDWRTPAARAFYCATSVNTMGLRRRRHFQCTRNRIDRITEEFLDSQHAIDSVLMTALNAPRADTMRDIVGTIQADQDEILRDTAHGILVIDGGPGTGKTSAALHRIAYLLYTEAHVLKRRGVLMVGPNPRFLRYVSEVLPSLGETGVAFCTPAELYPGVLANGAETVAAHRIKGQSRMLDVLARAVADRQELPADPVPIELDDVTVYLDAELCAAARERARSAGLAHNPARSVFLTAVVSAMADREWTFGHVVVDEAQELSPMQWRVLHRRCPVRSMTVAGDLAQGAGGPAAWGDVFAPGSWRLRTLHTNYRVPAPIMELAAAAVPGAVVPESLRGGDKPWRLRVPDLSRLAELVDEELAAALPGSVAVISAGPLAIAERDGLAVLTPATAKGLEFDVVIVVEPQRIPEPADRYVALTRPTQRLGLVHTEPLPAAWERLCEPR